MNQMLLALVILMSLSMSAHAQLGNMLNNLKSAPLMNQQGPIQDVMNKAKAISAAFSQMPLNSGKMELIKAAIPLLTQAKALSDQYLASVNQGKPNTNQTTQISGLLDQVKGLLTKQWSSSPLTPAQVPDVTKQSQQVTGLLSSVFANEGSALKGLLQMPAAH